MAATAQDDSHVIDTDLMRICHSFSLIRHANFLSKSAKQVLPIDLA